MVDGVLGFKKYTLRETCYIASQTNIKRLKSLQDLGAPHYKDVNSKKFLQEGMLGDISSHQGGILVENFADLAGYFSFRVVWKGC